MINNMKTKIPQELKNWQKEKELIPYMIKMYCHKKHHSKELCDECQKLTEYALFRLDKCPFKKNKRFCSFCKIHCYKEPYRSEIKEVMRYSGPRMIFTHPLFSFKHMVEMISYKRKMRK